MPGQGEDVTHGQVGHPLPGLHGGAADVREDDEVRTGQQGAGGGERLRGADIQPGTCTALLTQEVGEGREGGTYLLCRQC